MSPTPAVTNWAFSYNTTSNGTLYVPIGSKSAYESATGWNEFSDIIEIIFFDDASVKSICVANWDTDGDGELSKTEAAAVTDLGIVFKDNTTITSFNELQYFTGLTEINDYAFRNTIALTSVIIPENVTRIGKGSFGQLVDIGASNLVSVQLPDGLTEIDEDAFWECNKLKNINFPTSLRTIGECAFHNTAIESLILPEGFLSLGYSACNFCSFLKSIYIPSTVTSIGEGAFSFCNALHSIVVSEDNTVYDSRENCNALIKTETNKLIRGGNQTIIPLGICSIGDYAFDGLSNLYYVTIPKTVTSIGDGAFQNCNELLSVRVDIVEPLPITQYTFSDSWGRTYAGNVTLVVPTGSKAAYQAADYWKDFKEIVEDTPNITFADSNVKALCVANWDTNGDGELSESEAAAVTNLGTVFKNKTGITSFNELQYFTGLTSINYEAFYDCSGLTSVIIPNSVTEIDQNAFMGCSSLTSINIPDGVTSIYSNAFSNCSALPSITIPNSVTGISSGAFSGCSGLTNVTIPSSVTSIGGSAFANCSALTKAEFSSIEDICGMVFGSSSANPLSYSHHLYINGEEVTEVVIPDGVTSINYYAFSGCSGLTSVTIPSSVTSIRDNAFANCTGLSSVTIPAGVTSVGPYVFRGCTNLKSAIVRATDLDFWTFLESGIETLTIGSEVLRIRQVSGSSTVQFPFTNLKQLVIEDGDNNLSIDGYPFNGDGLYYSPFCESSLETIYLGRNIIGDYPPKSLWFGKALTLGGNGFYYYVDNDKLTSLSIGNKVTQIPEKMCGGCIGLTSISIPNSVTSIGSYAFQGCSSLTSISIPNSVTSIGSYAFGSCNSLTNVTVDLRTPLSISSGTFSNRANATLIVPVGSKAAYQAADYWKEFKRIVEDIYGDVNGDEEVDVVDVVDIVRYAIDNPSEAFVPILADINSSGEVNVGDAVSLVNIIAGDQNFAKAMRAPSRVEASDEALTLMSSGNGLSLCLENERSYTAFQFDLYVPDGTDVTSMLLNAQRKQKHQLLYNKVEDGHWRVAAISTSNRTFNDHDGELLSIALDGMTSGDINIRNALFFDNEGNAYRFSDILSSPATDIAQQFQPSNEEVQTIYDLNGRKMVNGKLPKGVYIVNGKKVLNK